MCRDKECDGKSCDCPSGKTERFIQPCLLLALRKQPSYGYELLEKILEFGFLDGPADPGMVYRHLRKLEEEGFVSSTWDTSGTGPARRYYSLTKEGDELLRDYSFYGKKFKESSKIFAFISGNHFDEREEKIMCCSENKSGCQCPTELKGKPEECTPLQIKKCHGTKAKHPCIPKRPKKK